MQAVSSKPPDSPDIIDGIGAIAGRYDHFILDIWGVLHDGIRPFPGTLPALDALRAQGKTVLLLSNTPNRDREIAQMLADMGITADHYDHIVTAGDSAHEDLKNYEGQACWYAGDSYAASLTGGLDIKLLPGHDGADAIINAVHGLNEKESADMKERLRAAAAKDLPMICSNPDMVVHVGEELKLCPGTFAAFYEEIGGHVTYHGKPHGPIYDRAWTLLGEPEKDSIVAIGDSLHTDIQGANNFGIDSVFNIDGIHREEIMYDARPGEADPRKIAAVIEKQPHKPDAVISGFAW